MSQSRLRTVSVQPATEDEVVFTCVPIYRYKQAADAMMHKFACQDIDVSCTKNIDAMPIKIPYVK